MSVFFYARVIIFGGFYGRVTVYPSVFKITAAVMPPSSLFSHGNSCTLHRYFLTREEAVNWGKFLKDKYTRAPSVSRCRNKQPELF